MPDVVIQLSLWTQMKPYLPLIIPLAIIQLGLMFWALIHLLIHRNTKIVNRWVWAVIIIVVSMIGPILYFALGRGENEDDH
ncbi:MAG: PLD nuclease N-terminal domain-containing protein [Propionibacteriaceae bacterium]|nr:PLD nuclease N-terminal domain-containing protein [Propionibacteriaceae bacterium]